MRKKNGLCKKRMEDPPRKSAWKTPRPPPAKERTEKAPAKACVFVILRNFWKKPALHDTFWVRAGIRAPRMTILRVLMFREHHMVDTFMKPYGFIFFVRLGAMVKLKKMLYQNIVDNALIYAEGKKYKNFLKQLVSSAWLSISYPYFSYVEECSESFVLSWHVFLICSFFIRLLNISLDPTLSEMQKKQRHVSIHSFIFSIRRRRKDLPCN